MRWKPDWEYYLKHSTARRMHVGNKTISELFYISTQTAIKAIVQLGEALKKAATQKAGLILIF